MRRLISIMLLTMYLVYQAGYICFYWMATNSIEQYWANQLEFNTPKKTVSIPLTIPYKPDDADYSPTDGSITFQGKPYRKVFQRYAQDTLHIVLVEDVMTARLHASVQDWIEHTTDTPNERNSKTTLIQVNSKEYHNCELFDLNSFISCIPVSNRFYYSFSDQSITGEVLVPPPQSLIHS